MRRADGVLATVVDGLRGSPFTKNFDFNVDVKERVVMVSDAVTSTLAVP